MTPTIPRPVADALSFLAQVGIRPLRWWVFGQDPACGPTRIVDEYASGFHTLAFEVPQGVFWVMDLGSLNGTWLTVSGSQRRQVTGAGERIRPGDTLRIGRTDLPWSTP